MSSFGGFEFGASCPPSPMSSLFGARRFPAEDPTGPHQSLLGGPLPTDVAALQSMVITLLAEVKATTSVNTYLAASVARLQASQSAQSMFTHTLPTTDNSTPAPTTPFSGLLVSNPRTIASGRGCASPELFQKLVKKNWHGRLGRTHMADVDALPASALAELDCLLRRKLHTNFPRGGYNAPSDPDATFASIAALGLRLEDRGAYADLPIANDNRDLTNEPTLRRGTNLAAWYLSKGSWVDYWKGVLQETMVELAKYRGLFDDEGFVKTE